MKLRFLDVRNCHSLLPEALGLPLVHRLEKCLQQINDNRGGLHGSIDALIRYNKKTSHKARGSQRLCNSNIEIAQTSFVGTQIGNTRAQVRPGPGPARLFSILASNGPFALAKEGQVGWFFQVSLTLLQRQPQKELLFIIRQDYSSVRTCDD